MNQPSASAPRVDSRRHEGATAIVTGAASGIGRATVKRLTAEGAAVVACDRDGDRLKSLRRRAPDRITTVVADVTDQTSVDEVLATATAGGRTPTLLANVAGVGDGMLPVGEIDDETWRRVIDVNLTGTMRFARAVLPAFQESGGAIINISSVAGLSGGAGGAAYTASKHGVIGLTRSIAYLYGSGGIRCNAICPGAVATRIGHTAAPKLPWVAERMEVAMARNPGFVDPDNIAALISWLGSAEAANINGAVINADGGWLAS